MYPAQYDYALQTSETDYRRYLFTKRSKFSSTDSFNPFHVKQDIIFSKAFYQTKNTYSATFKKGVKNFPTDKKFTNQCTT